MIRNQNDALKVLRAGGEVDVVSGFNMGRCYIKHRNGRFEYLHGNTWRALKRRYRFAARRTGPFEMRYRLKETSLKK